MDLRCCVDGFDGRHAADGHPGCRGSHGMSGWSGGHGGDGGPAGIAQPGGHAGSIEVQLASSLAGGNAWVSVTGRAGTNPVNYNVRDERVGALTVSAKGGRGGNGGAGGRGGDGGEGGRGHDATRYSSGGNGGHGGSGGPGGIGSHGAAGGNAGNIAIHVAEEDVYLLTALSGSTAPSAFVQGGGGGRRGRHGQGGSAGKGGRGGSSHHWTETHTVTRDGESHTETTYHSNPGGCNGRSGNHGLVPQMRLSDGAQGNCGSFAILAHSPNGLVRQYPHRFDLGLSNFILQEVGPDADGVFEFGEIVHATGFFVQNIGGMPTPSLQRQRLDLAPGRFVRPVHGDAIFVPRQAPIGVGDKRKVDGLLRFQIGFPTDSRMDFDPIVVTEDVRPRAFQLGIETPEKNGIGTAFQRQFSNFSYTRTLTARYPIQNVGGIHGLRSLAAGEWTRIELRLNNISTLPFGRARRRVRVEFRAAQGSSIHAEKLRLRFQDGDAVPSTADGGDVDVMSGHFFEIEHIDPHGNTSICGEVGFHTDMPLYGYAELRAAIYIEDLNVKGSWRCVQRRALPLRCEPAFDPKPATQAILVCSTATKQKTFEDWHMVLTRRFCFNTAVFSITRYGHFDPSKPLPISDTSHGNYPSLGNFLGGRLIVVLDDQFADRTLGEALLRPSALLSSWHFSSYFGPEPPHYLVVAEPGTRPAGVLDQLVYPLPSSALPLNRRHHYDTVEEWIKANEAIPEQTQGVDSSQWKRSSDPMLEFDMITVCSCLPGWSSAPTDKCKTDALNKKADHVVDYIKKWRPDLQNAIVVPFIDQASSSQPAKGNTITKTWKMGEIYIFGTRGMGGVQGRLTHAAMEGKEVTGAASLFAVARALGPKEKIATLVRLIGGNAEPTTTAGAAAAQATCQALLGAGVSDTDGTNAGSNNEVVSFPQETRALAHSLCADIVDEYLKMLAAGPRLPSGMMPLNYRKRYLTVAKDYMPTLKLMVESTTLHAAMPHSDPYIPACIIGTLEALAKAPGLKLWFAPLGRQRKLGRLLEWAARELTKCFACGHEGAKKAAEHYLRDINNLRLKQGLPLMAVWDKSRQAAASVVARRFSAASLANVDSSDCCDLRVVRGCAKGATKILATHYNQLRQEERERDVHLQKMSDQSAQRREKLHVGDTVEAQTTEASAPGLESWPTELTGSFTASDGAVPAWACFDGFCPPPPTDVNFEPSAPPPDA